MAVQIPDKHRLAERIAASDNFVIAVSGGVDSMTLALFCSAQKANFQVYHAVSPAVPVAATARVRSFARQQDWWLHEIVADEFQDPDYMKNPLNRCFHCKKNLYAEIRKTTDSTIFSGTNLDDLSDFRPGLKAAAQHAVEHPFVDARITKAGIRELARSMNLPNLAELPASPCLSSRIETGVAIDAPVLLAIDKVESWIDRTFGFRGARCRVRADRIAVELADPIPEQLGDETRQAIISATRQAFGQLRPGHPVLIEAYRKGSAFLQGAEEL